MGGTFLFSVQSIVTALLSFVLGVFTLANNYKKRQNQLWFLVSIAITVWSLGLGLEVISTSDSLALIFNRLLYCGATLIPIFFYHFIADLLDITEKRRFSVSFGYIFFVFFFFANFTPYFVTGVPAAFGFNHWVSTGILYVPYFIGFAFYLLYSMFTLIYYLKKVRGRVKDQVRYVLLANIFGFIGGVTNFFPQLFSVYPFGNYIFWLYIVFITYAIIKHRLMDIRLVVARSVAYLTLIAIMAGFYAGAVMGIENLFFPETLATFNWTAGILRTLLAVIMAFSFQPLRRWITKATDKIFFKNAYDPEQLLDTLAHTIGSTIVLIELCYKALDLILSEIKITRGLLVILTDSGNVYTSQAKGYQTYPKIEPHDVERLVHDGIIVYDELEETSKYKHLLSKYNASVAIPLKTESTTEGLLLLGEKESGDMYSQNDLKVFEIIAPELGVAITNAKSYEKIEKFNVTLREEVKKATAELEKKNTQLMELDKAKDEFISMASHQLRTPLTAIKGYLSMLLEGDAGEIKVSQYDFVNEAFNGANRMVGLINDLLNVSRMETGRFFLEPVEVDMIKLVEEEMKQLQNNAKEKKLYLKFDLKKKKVPHVWVDETKMRQVVMNFIDNALYYTTEGGVTVSLDADAKDIIFKVEDTGIGVPKEQQKNLFTKFYRADNARHVRPDGTGLGIYLAKRVMDDHGGEIIFHSTEGKGSTFGFKMPIKSKLKMKRVTAPAPGSGTTPAIGELAAGIGVSAEALEATQEQKPAPEIPQDKIDIAKAAGVEAPLPDSSDAKDMAKEADLIKKAAAEVKEPVKK